MLKALQQACVDPAQDDLVVAVGVVVEVAVDAVDRTYQLDVAELQDPCADIVTYMAMMGTRALDATKWGPILRLLQQPCELLRRICLLLGGVLITFDGVGY